jgi:hypothetical protein
MTERSGQFASAQTTGLAMTVKCHCEGVPIYRDDRSNLLSDKTPAKVLQFEQYYGIIVESDGMVA